MRVVVAIWPLLGLPAWLLGQSGPEDCPSVLMWQHHPATAEDCSRLGCLLDESSSLGLSWSWLVRAIQRGGSPFPLPHAPAVPSCTSSSLSPAPSYGPGTLVCRELCERYPERWLLPQSGYTLIRRQKAADGYRWTNGGVQGNNQTTLVSMVGSRLYTPTA